MKARSDKCAKKYDVVHVGYRPVKSLKVGKYRGMAAKCEEEQIEFRAGTSANGNGSDTTSVFCEQFPLCILDFCLLMFKRHVSENEVCPTVSGIYSFRWPTPLSGAFQEMTDGSEIA